MQQEVRRFVPRTLPPVQPVATSRAERERQAKAYWDSLTPQQEGWVLQKMGFHSLGEVARAIRLTSVP
jgi:hypothetical protein